jgi:hypothetical protein
MTQLHGASEGMPLFAISQQARDPSSSTKEVRIGWKPSTWTSRRVSHLCLLSVSRSERRDKTSREKEKDRDIQEVEDRDIQEVKGETKLAERRRKTGTGNKWG